MSIVAHVEPRDMAAVFGDRRTTPGTTTPVAALLPAADQGTAEEQVADMKEAAHRLSRTQRRTGCSSCPNLIVADKEVTGLPENAISRVL